MLTFAKGERLTADKMNALARSLGDGYDVPGTGFKGKTFWTSERQTRPGRDTAVPETFQMSYLFDDDVIKGFKLSNCRFFEGSVMRELSDQVVLPDAPRSVSQISLVELSAKPLPPDPRWKVLDNIAIEMEYPTEDGVSVVNEWPLYFMDSAFVCCDVRTSFVQTIGGAGGGAGGVNLDLSSLNWGEISSTDPEAKPETVAQSRNWQKPLSGDLLEIEGLSDVMDCRFMARPEGGGTLKYASLSGILSALSAGGGGGGCSCEMSAVAKRYDDDWSGSPQQYWENAEVGQFKDCSGNETTLYAPNHVQMSCNMYPYFTNMGSRFTFDSGVSSNVQIVPDGTRLTFNVFYVGLALAVAPMAALFM